MDLLVNFDKGVALRWAVIDIIKFLKTVSI
jgi:hypothetical protein